VDEVRLTRRMKPATSALVTAIEMNARSFMPQNALGPHVPDRLLQRRGQKFGKQRDGFGIKSLPLWKQQPRLPTAPD
jgi:hypothetical protein